MSLTVPEDRRMDHCAEHRETVADDSPRGEKYPDDRTLLAYVYDGETLKAGLYDESEVRRYRETTLHDVVLTPAGECRIEGRCREVPREGGSE